MNQPAARSLRRATVTQIVEALMQPVAEEPQGQVLASITALERLRGKGNLKTSTHNAVSTVLFKRDSTSPIGRIVFAMLGSVMGLTPVKKRNVCCFNSLYSTWAFACKYLSNKFGLDSPHFFYDILYIIYFGVKFSVAFNLFLSLLVSHSMNKQMGRSQFALFSQDDK